MRPKTNRNVAWIFWLISLVIGLVALGLGVLFWIEGPEMMVMTIIFAGSGGYVVLLALPRVLGWESS